MVNQNFIYAPQIIFIDQKKQAEQKLKSELENKEAGENLVDMIPSIGMKRRPRKPEHPNNMYNYDP